jgi:hypothetical protein
MCADPWHTPFKRRVPSLSAAYSHLLAGLLTSFHPGISSVSTNNLHHVSMHPRCLPILRIHPSPAGWFHAGNNTYKAVQQSTGAIAMGPVMQVSRQSWEWGVVLGLWGQRACGGGRRACGAVGGLCWEWGVVPGLWRWPEGWRGCCHDGDGYGSLPATASGVRGEPRAHM